MRTARSRIAPHLIAIGVVSALLAGCASVPEEEEPEEGAAEVQPIKGTDLARVILTDEAAERLDIKEATVEVVGQDTVIPYAAVFYTATGETWAYTAEELTFVRAPIEIDHIVGNRVFLSDGPPAGTTVVTQGLSELYGTETGVEE
jgi:uncharacterized protein YceK